MAKNPNRKPKSASWDGPMTGAMKFFLAGCVAELYLLIVRRYYVNGNIDQMLAWYSTYLRVFIGAGAVLLVLGVVLWYLWRQNKKKRAVGYYLAGGGAFLAASSALALWNMNLVSTLTIVVPAVMIMGILWSLYDRECALSLTVLGVSLIALWFCRPRMSYGYLKIAVVVYIVLLVVIALLAKAKKLAKLLPPKASLQPIYLACGLSVLAMATTLVSATVAYYAMWALALVVFALAVYYTVKQL